MNQSLLRFSKFGSDFHKKFPKHIYSLLSRASVAAITPVFISLGMLNQGGISCSVQLSPEVLVLGKLSLKTLVHDIVFDFIPISSETIRLLSKGLSPCRSFISPYFLSISLLLRIFHGLEIVLSRRPKKTVHHNRGGKEVTEVTMSVLFSVELDFLHF